MHDNVSAGERVTASMRISRIPYLFPSPLLSSALTPPLSLPSFLVSFLSSPSYPLCSFLSYLVSPLSFSFLSILFFPVPYPILYRLFILLVSSLLSNPSFRYPLLSLFSFCSFSSPLSCLLPLLPSLFSHPLLSTFFCPHFLSFPSSQPCLLPFLFSLSCSLSSFFSYFVLVIFYSSLKT